MLFKFANRPIDILFLFFFVTLSILTIKEYILYNSKIECNSWSLHPIRVHRSALSPSHPSQSVSINSISFTRCQSTPETPPTKSPCASTIGFRRRTSIGSQSNRLPVERCSYTPPRECDNEHTNGRITREPMLVIISSVGRLFS